VSDSFLIELHLTSDPNPQEHYATSLLEVHYSYHGTSTMYREYDPTVKRVLLVTDDHGDIEINPDDYTHGVDEDGEPVSLRQRLVDAAFTDWLYHQPDPEPDFDEPYVGYMEDKGYWPS
jgi:hypothetical protein